MAIRAYRTVVSPLLSALCTPFGLGCRFTPTCSQYGLDAVKTHGAWRGSLLSIRRICRCHPWGGEGYDPVPICKEIDETKNAPSSQPSPPVGEREKHGLTRMDNPDDALITTTRTRDEGRRRERQSARIPRPPLRASPSANS